MRCVCGAILPLGSRYSICPECLANDPDDDFGDCPDNWDEFEDGLSAVEADAMALAGAGYGTDEDYCFDTPMGDDYYGGE